MRGEPKHGPNGGWKEQLERPNRERSALSEPLAPGSGVSASANCANGETPGPPRCTKCSVPFLAFGGTERGAASIHGAPVLVVLTGETSAKMDHAKGATGMSTHMRAS